MDVPSFLSRLVSTCPVPLRDIEAVVTFPTRKSFSFCVWLTALWKGNIFGTSHALQLKKELKDLINVKTFSLEISEDKKTCEIL